MDKGTDPKKNITTRT